MRYAGRASVVVALSLLAAGDLGARNSGSATIVPGLQSCIWKTTDIIDTKIDIGAQKSLMRQMAAGAPGSAVASAIIGAVKSKTLAGVLLPPRQAVSERGKRMTPPKGYWQLIPAGRNSTCLKEPAGEPPLIVYRENLQPAQIDAALKAAWAECGLPTPEPPCGFVVNAWKPTPAEPECRTDRECQDKGLGWKCLNNACVECETTKDCLRFVIGNRCTPEKLCVTDYEKPRDEPPSCSQQAHCPAGWTCTNGRCLPPNSPQHQCYERVKKEWRAKDKQCEDDELPRLAECTVEHATKPPALAICLKQSYDEKTKCKKTAYQEFQTKQKVCYAS